MHPIQRTWSQTRINLMQKCPRAFVLRYGIAAYATKHPTGQMLREYFSIQTPWILMQISIRETIRDYVEDYQIGMKWSKNLIRLKFNQFFRHRVKERNSIISELSAWKDQKSMFHRVKPEQHLEEIGAKRCIKLIQHKSFTHLLNTMTFESISPLKSKIVDGIKVYNSPDFCAEKGETSILIRINLFGYSSIDHINQNAALISLGTEKKTIVQYSWKNGKWFIHKTNVSKKENKSIRSLIRLDSKEMERILKLVGTKNNLEQIPFADSSRSCMHCSVRFLCPAKDRLEEAKGEQMALMC
jgi:hypothetical protein